MSIFKGQTLLTITLDAGQNITAASTLEIDFIKPSQLNGTWTATASGTNSLRYEIVSGDIDESGTWKLQSSVTISGKVAKGVIVNMEVLETLV